jgi:hypothetical protein
MMKRKNASTQGALTTSSPRLVARLSVAVKFIPCDGECSEELGDPIDPEVAKPKVNKPRKDPMARAASMRSVCPAWREDDRPWSFPASFSKQDALEFGSSACRAATRDRCNATQNL